MAAVPDDVLVHPTSGPSGRPIDALDLAEIPIFVGTMITEALVLRRRAAKREAVDPGAVAVLGPHDLPADPLVPLGYERRDTAASLAMLLGNVAVNLAAAGVIGKLSTAVYNRRIADIGARRGSLADRDRRVGLPLLLGSSLDARGASVLGQPRLTPFGPALQPLDRAAPTVVGLPAARGSTCRCHCSGSPLTT